MKRIEILAGTRFGRVEYVEEREPSRTGSRLRRCALFVCDCGTRFVAPIENVRYGQKKSCGCLAIASRSLNHRIHGETKKKRERRPASKEYRAWSCMKYRCSPGRSRQTARYDDYAGRGISVCERWEDFRNFLADMGRAPSDEHSIDRIDVNGNYEPGNCRWATRAEQMANRRNNVFVVVDGERLTVAQAAQRLGIKYGTVFRRVREGRDPVTGRHPHDTAGASATINQRR